MTLDSEQMLALLPAQIRLRDEREGGPLRAMFELLAGQGALVQDNIEELMRAWFIETCPDWAIPYIGDLLDVRGVYDLDVNDGYSPRAWVANTIRFRRRKGTLAMLETLAHDTTGWPSKAVEMFRLLSATQNVNHARADAAATALIRDADRMALEGGAFATSPRHVDVRSIARRQGRYNIPNVGLFQWRLQAYPLAEADAAAKSPNGRFHFDPLGRDLPLFNPPKTEDAIEHLAEDVNMPGPLWRRPLHRELDARRQNLVDGAAIAAHWFDQAPPFEVWLQPTPGAAFAKLQPEDIAICDIYDAGADWRRPPSTLSYTARDGTAVARTIKAGVDPLRGRLALPTGAAAQAARVSYAYAYPGDVGGGPYDRRASVGAILDRRVTWQAGVTRRLPAAGRIFASVAEAFIAWRGQPAGTCGVIAVMDNEIFTETLTGANKLVVPEGSFLLITAAGWPETPKPAGGVERVPGKLSPQDRRAVIRGNIEVEGTAPADSVSPGVLAIDGILIDGRINVTAAATSNLGRLIVSHATIGPATGGISVAGDHDDLALDIRRSLVGPILLSPAVPAVTIVESIVDAAGGLALQGGGADAVLDGVTVLGRSDVKSVSATDCIFAQRLAAERHQSGCLRFSYVAPGSTGPRRFRCQPDLAEEAAAPGEDVGALRARLTPIFNSETYGSPAYGRLAETCAAEIRSGSENGSAMGVFRFLRERQREANLATGIDEYLGIGLEAASIYET